MAATFRTSGKFEMGATNPYQDYIPAQMMYEAVREVNKRVVQLDATEWDFSGVFEHELTEKFRCCIADYLAPLSGYNQIAWKLPEATMAIPWLVRLFPDAYYIHWVRDGRDNILKWHGSQEFATFSIPAMKTDDVIHDGAVCWKYHMDLIEAIPKPERWLTVRYEDFVQSQRETVNQMASFVDESLPLIPVHRGTIGQYTAHDLTTVMPIMRRHLERFGYGIVRSAESCGGTLRPGC